MKYNVLKNGRTAGVLDVKAFKAGKSYRILVLITPEQAIPEVDFGVDSILFKKCGVHTPAMTKICFEKLSGYKFALVDNSTRSSVEFLAYPVRKEKSVEVQGTIHI